MTVTCKQKLSTLHFGAYRDLKCFVHVAENLLKLFEDLSMAIEDALSVKHLFLRLNNLREVDSVLVKKACLEIQDMDYDIGKMTSLKGMAE